MRVHPDLGARPIGRTRVREGLWLAVALLLVVTVWVRAVNLDRIPVTDELYTFLAAQGWLETGAPQIGDGIYERAQAYSFLLAGWLAAFGDNLLSARVLSLVFGSCLVLAVFLWTRRVAGPLAAWITGVFMALAPLSVDVSQFIRFYALHALVFWLATAGAYALVTRPHSPGRRALLAFAVILGFLFALHLQMLTLLGLAGVALWLVLAVGIPWLRAQPPRRRQAVLITAVALILLAGAALLVTGKAEALLERYRWAPLWNRAHRNEFWYYHVYFVERWPTLWSLTPLALLLAVVKRPRPAVLCMCIFVVSFVLLSFGGMKDPRYIFFALPYLFVLWGIALAKAFELLYPWLVGAIDRVLRRFAPYLAGRPVRIGLIAAGVVFLVASNGDAVKALLSLGGTRLIAAEGGGVGVFDEAGRADWSAARNVLAPLFDEVSIILTSRDVHFLHYLGDYDVTLSGNRMTEVRGDEFGLDQRTGKVVIGSADALGRIINCFPSGLIVTDTDSWRSTAGVQNKVADMIEAETVKVALPPEAHILAFRWEHPVPDPPLAACDALHGIEGLPRSSSATGSPPVDEG